MGGHARFLVELLEPRRLLCGAESLEGPDCVLYYGQWKCDGSVQPPGPDPTPSDPPPPPPPPPPDPTLQPDPPDPPEDPEPGTDPEQWHVNLVAMGMNEHDEECPGGFMQVNNTFDENNRDNGGYLIPDNQYDATHGPRIIAGDAELRSATLYISAPEGVTEGGWSIGIPGVSKIRLWMWKGAPVNKCVDIYSMHFETSSMPLTRSFIIEGITHSSELRDVSIHASAWGEQDVVKLTVLEVDTDVDSDNNNGPSNPLRTPREDGLEDHQGKIMSVNDGDSDGDGIPDFADGYNLYGGDSASLEGVSFIPYILDLSGVSFFEDTRIGVLYNPSSPNGVTRTGAGTAADPYTYTPQGQYSLRLWTKNAHERIAPPGSGIVPGNPVHDDGYFVQPWMQYTVEDFRDAGAEEIPAAGSGVFRLWIEAVHPVAGPFAAMISILADPDGPEGSAGFMLADAVRIKPMKVDLDVDTNRDGDITDADDADEEKWEKGEGKPGALVLPNSDNDSGGIAPDNWVGGDWDLDGAADPANTKVDGNGDIDDIAPGWAKKLGLDALPDNLLVKVQVSRVADEHEFFGGPPGGPVPVLAKDRVRLFLPSLIDGNDLKLKQDDEEIIGPTKGDTVEFVKTPAGDTQRSYDIFKGAGLIKFGIEGIEAGGMVDITFTMLVGADEIAKDVVRMRVSPFALTDQRNAVAAGAAGSETVFVENLEAELRDKLNATYPGAVEVTTIGDPWHQDGYEIGYAQAPSYAQGAQPNQTRSIPVVLELPRSIGPMQEFLRTSMLRANLAVITPFRDRDFPAHTQNSGGNIESLPKAGGGPGYFFHGNLMAAVQVEFFEAQEVNEAKSVTTDWLRVGHVDEVVSLASDGTRVMVADAELAWGLLVWANELNAGAPMLPGMVGVPAPGTVGAIVADPAIRDFNMGWVMHPENLPSIRNEVSTLMGVTGPVSAPTAGGGNAGGATLAKGGAFVGLFGNTNPRSYEIEFLDDINYQLRHQEAGGPWSGWIAGRRDQDGVFEDARAYILQHWWSGVPEAEDTFTFSANPTAKLIEMPVLFFEEAPLEASALTIDFINSLVDGLTVVTGRAHGPSVNWSGTGASDILEDYTDGAFGLAGITNIVRADAREYHNRHGFIHCATNVIREIPDEEWWNF